MRRLRVGVWVDNKSYKPEAGGVFGYNKELIEKIVQYNFADTDVLLISNERLSSDLNCYKIKWRYTFFKKIRSRLIKLMRVIPGMKRLTEYIKTFEEKDLQKLNNELSSVVDIIYYPTPKCVFPEFPFIYTLWDSGHLSTYAFPEVSNNGEFESRKFQNDIIPYKALMIFAESEEGKKEIEYYYRINPDRIQVVSLFPSKIIEQTFPFFKPIGINEDEMFIHYPAQFWAHKNHYNLILAFKIVLVSFPSLKLVLTGSDKGNKEYIISLINELGLREAVIDLGFVSMEELKWLYLNSKGLVMPTFLGPTNMPLLEAAELGCPVSCSNLKGQQEQLGEYGYYFDPKNPNEMAIAITQMLNDKVEGTKKRYTSAFNINNALLSIEKAFLKIRDVRFTWK